MSGWSAAKQAGLVLAALLCEDRALARVERALPPDLVESGRARLLPSQSGRAKAALITELLAEVRPPLTDLAPGVPARLAALLAPRLPRNHARRLVAAVSRARPGYAPEPELLPRLFRIARHTNAVAERSRAQSDGQASANARPQTEDQARTPARAPNTEREEP